jgi:hypothetical protein
MDSLNRDLGDVWDLDLRMRKFADVLIGEWSMVNSEFRTT